ncbi:hypothetical protein ACTXT7_016326 [Hymenolepis weldensis]
MDLREHNHKISLHQIPKQSLAIMIGHWPTKYQKLKPTLPKLTLLGSCPKEQVDKKRAQTKCCNRQLQADAKELFSGDAEGWLANPCSKIPEND